MQLQRTLSIVLGLAAIALAAVVAVKSAPRLPSAPGVMADGGVAVLSDAGAASSIATTAPAVAAAGEPSADAGVLLLSDLAQDEATGATGGQGPNGLPNGSPRQVRFGVVLVQYEGAQDARGKLRSKADAVTLAHKLAEEAKSDFSAAVQHGDQGSSGDLGRMRRGVLEPATEVVLFTLPVGGVSDVIDTPRGFWIAKRLE